MELRAALEAANVQLSGLEVNLSVYVPQALIKDKLVKPIREAPAGDILPQKSSEALGQPMLFEVMHKGNSTRIALFSGLLKPAEIKKCTICAEDKPSGCQPIIDHKVT